MSCLPTDIAFLQKLFIRFEKEEIPYCVLRNSSEILNGDAHDIDMVVESKSFSTVREILANVSGDQWRIHYASEKDNGNLVTVHLYSIDNGKPILVHFDFFDAFGWNGYRLISNEQLLKGRKKRQWLYEASYPVQAVSMLFSRYLYHGYIKEKYRSFIRQVFKNQTNEVESIMRCFLPENYVMFIINDVLDGNWNSIEQEHPVVAKAIITFLGKTQKHCAQKMLLFNIRRIRKCTGIVVGMGNGNSLSEYHSYAIKVQNTLSRTFSTEDIMEMYKEDYGGYRLFAQYQLKNRISLSKGKLIFTDDVRPARDKVVIADISTIPPILTATTILEAMSRRYM